MDLNGSISQVQAILIGLVSVGILWVAVATLFTKSRKGDVPGAAKSLLATIFPVILVVLAVAGIAVAVVSGALSSVGIGG